MESPNQFQSVWDFPPRHLPPDDSSHKPHTGSESKTQKLYGQGDTTKTKKWIEKAKDYAQVDNSWFERFNHHTPREKVRLYLNKAQIVLGLMTMVFGLIVPEIRTFILHRSLGGHVTVFIMEFGAWSALTILLGRINAIPVNFVALLIMRTFLSLELQWEWELEQVCQAKKSWLSSLIDSSYFSFFSNPPPPPIEEPNVWNIYARSCLMLVVILSFGCILTKWTHIRIDKIGNSILVGSFFVSAFAAVIMVSSLAISWIGKDLHLLICNIWAAFALLAVFVLPFYLLQRFICSTDEYWVRRKLQAEKENAWMFLEITLCLLQVTMVVRCIPAFHHEFNLANVIGYVGSTSWSHLFIPKEMFPLGEGIPHLFFIIRMVMEKVAISIPDSMRMDNYNA